MAPARHYRFGGRFGEFSLDVGERVLYRNGALVSLTPKALETLLFLVERHGHVVDKKDLIRAIWPGVFVEEVSLARNISVLRKVLSDGQDGLAYIETIPKRGYRFVAEVSEVRDGGEAAERVVAVTPENVCEGRPAPDMDSPVATPPRWMWWMAAVVPVALISLVLFAAFRPRDMTPRVTRAVPVTSFGRAADPLAHSGDRLFIGVRTGGSRQIAQVDGLPASSPAENPLILPTNLPKPYIFDVSPDGSRLLIGTEAAIEEERQLWVMNSAGGSPKRLGNLVATGAGWSPDGRRIAYTSGSAVFTADADGTSVRKLTDVSGTTYWPRWSPDRRVIRFTVEEPKSQAASLWEIDAGGGSARNLFPQLSRASDHWGMGPAYGSWTRDGKYFFFLVGRRPDFTVWAQKESRGFLGVHASPEQIFVSPFSLGPPVPSRDGKRLFLAVHQEDRALMKYDAAQQRFVSWFGGASVSSFSYSEDHEWVAYVTFNDGVLWRARADGREILRLSDFSKGSFGSAFSPDGRRIAFYDAEAPQQRRIFVVATDGGSPAAVTNGDDSAPSWFPDGSVLYRHQIAAGRPGGDAAGLYRLDLTTGRKERIQGSEGKADSVVSPDGRYIAAVTEDLRRVMLFSFATQEWRELAAGAFVRSPCWSRDSKFIYFQDYYEGSQQPVYRVRLSGGPVERVATSAEFQRSDVYHGYVLQGLGPDGSPIVSLLRNKSDVYALELSYPR